MSASPTLWLAPSTAAQTAGVSIPTIRRAIKSGELPAFRLSARCIRIRAPDLDQWISRKPYQVEKSA
jgi:excisionase family DNA binding protein